MKPTTLERDHKILEESAGWLLGIMWYNIFEAQRNLLRNKHHSHVR